MIKNPLTKCVALAGVIFATSYTSVQAQPIYTNTFNNPLEKTNWVVLFDYTANNAVSGSTAAFNVNSNNLVNFNYDYTTMGIPLAPHSVEFGSDTIHHGMRISACYTNAVTFKTGGQVVGLSACPTNFSVSANFIMHADMWINIDCGAYAFPLAVNTNNTASATYAYNNHDGTASTVLYGCGYGTAGTLATTPGQSDAIWCGVLTDNGTTADVRMYSSLQTGSYQDGTYQFSGTTTPAVGDALVYNLVNGGTTGTGNGPGTRNIVSSGLAPAFTPAQMSSFLNNNVALSNAFPSAIVPLQEAVNYPQQTNNCSIPGFMTFGWHDVSVEKVGNVIIYKIDGNIMATGNYNSAGTPAGNFLTFVASRTGTSVASPASGSQYTNLNFAVFANIVVSNYNNIVNVTTTAAQASETAPATPIVFDVSRPSAGVPLTVLYSLTGTATNGVQYTNIPYTVTFASTATDTNIYIYPIDDGIPSATRSVTLTLISSNGYIGAGNAIGTILDGDTPTIDITGTGQAYGRYTNTTEPFGGGNNSDFITFAATRRGLLTTGSPLTVNLSYGGNGAAGVDFAPVSSFSIADGAQTSSVTIFPLDNTTITSNQTFTVNIAAGTGYGIGNNSATGTVVTAHYPVNTVLASDDLQSPADSVNWGVTYGTSDEVNDPANYNVVFGTGLSSSPFQITPTPPPGGNMNALFMQCNRNNSISPAPGAVNCYYTNLVLSGNYAVRFNMNLIQSETLKGTGANASEGAVFGINHTGSCSNWWFGSGFTTNLTWSSDGVWYYVSAQAGSGGGGGDFAQYTGAGGTNGNAGWMQVGTKTQAAFASAFKDKPGPFTTFDANGVQTAGQPANGNPVSGWDISTWSDVEMKQQGDGLGNLVDTLSINHTQVFSYTNTTVWTGGYLMLGYEDPFGASIGNSESGVYYANLQVVQLPATVLITTTINSINITGGNVVINFSTTSSADTISSFTLEGSSVVNVPKSAYTAVGSTTITSLGSSQFQASTPYTGSNVFYLIKHN